MAPHDRWLISPKIFIKVGEVVPIEFCVGHGFESESAPSEWWLTKFYVLDPEGEIRELYFSFEKGKQSSAYGEFIPSKEGTYMIYSIAEKIFFVRTLKGEYLQFKDKIGVENSLIKSSYIGWQYCKTFLKVEKSCGNAFQKIVGGLIELVPQKDPTNLKTGDSLSIKILSEGRIPNWNIGIVALYKDFPGEKWTYSFYAEFLGSFYAKEGIEKESVIEIPIVKNGYWFVKAFRLMDREILCENKYGNHDAYFFEATMTTYIEK